MVRQWTEVTIRIPIDVEQGDAGLFYITSPLLKGLLVAERTEKEALASLPSRIEDMAVAASGPVQPATQT